MTYNIEMYKDDGWGGRDITKTVGTIIDANPDVVGVQEDCDEWIDSGKLSALTDGGYTRVAFDGNGEEHLNIFYKTAKFSLVESGQLFFKKLADGDYSSVDANGADMDDDDCGDREYGSRKGCMFSYVILEFLDAEGNGTGETVLVVNTHLHYGSTKTNATNFHLLREYEARILRAWLDDKAEQYPNQIVMGDMNAHITDRGAATLSEYTKNDGLLQARNEALLKSDTGGTLTSTSSYTDRDYVFDHILFRNMKAIEYSVIDNTVDNGKYPSDHLPVISTFICYAE